MSRSRIFLITLLALVVLVLLGWNLSSSDEDEKPILPTSEQPTYQSKFTDTLVYDPTGTLQYELIASDVAHYANQEDSWFYQPKLTLFGKDATATWTVSSDKAKLNKDRMLYLYGHVKVRSLTPTSQLKAIDTESAQVDLTSQDIASQEEVSLSGEGFRSQGLKMRGNLRDKNAELLEKVITTYETQKH